MAVKPGYKQTDVGVLPQDWSVVAVEQITHSHRQGFYTTNRYVRQGVRLVRITDLMNPVVDYSEMPMLRVSGADFDRYQVKPGDFLFARSGAIGRYGIVYQTVPAIFGSYIIRFTFDAAKVVPEYFGFVYGTEIVARQLASITQGSSNININAGNINAISIPLPPLPEQRAIAGALSDVDALIDALTQLIAKKRDLKQAAMQQLLTGQTRLPGFSGEWSVKRLGTVADVDPENLGSETSPDYAFKYISLEDVDTGTLNSHAELTFGGAPSRARRRLRKGDVLVSTVRPNLKSHLLFDLGEDAWVCSTGFAVVRCKERVAHPGYLFSHMFGSGIVRQIDALLTGSNYPAINSGDVRALEIPFPDYAEQTAIAEVLLDMNAELAALEQRSDKTRDLKQGMMQELLTGRTRLV